MIVLLYLRELNSSFSFAGRFLSSFKLFYATFKFIGVLTFFIPKKNFLIKQQMRAFLWVGKITTQYNAKISWDKVCLAKVEGGLGLRRLSIWICSDTFGFFSKMRGIFGLLG